MNRMIVKAQSLISPSLGLRQQQLEVASLCWIQSINPTQERRTIHNQNDSLNDEISMA